MKKILLTSMLAFCGLQYTSAQAPGSESVYGGGATVKSITSGGTSADVSESLYIGPGTHIIDGTWEIYAKNVVIEPTAVISGTGTIQFYNPSVAGGAASATLIDGNNVSGAIDVNMELHNATGMALTNIAFPATLTGAGWVDDATASTVYVGKDLSLAVDGADVTLGTGVVGDLRFDADATISNYRPARMVIVNNSILSHMVKESFTSAFTFPVGMADGDYTPATLTNVSAITVNVSVQDYTASTAPEATTDPGPGGVPADGINRTWHIFGATAGTGTTVNLQHNSSTNQSGFTDASHFVTQWGTTTPNATGDISVSFSTSPWQTNTLGVGVTGTLLTPSGTLAGSSMRSRSYTALATSTTAEESYFTKSADPFHPLPLLLTKFALSTSDCKVNISFSTGQEDGMKSIIIQTSTDGSAFVNIATIAAKGDNSNYNYVQQNPTQGKNMYRLYCPDAQESGKYSNVRLASVTCAGLAAPKVLVYPNPAGEQLNIVLQGNSQSNRYELIDALGRLVLRGSLTTNSNNKVDVSGLNIGSYNIRITTDTEVITEKVQILR